MQTLNRDAKYKHVIFEAPENESLSHMSKRVGISKIYYYSLCNTVVNNHSWATMKLWIYWHDL